MNDIYIQVCIHLTTRHSLLLVLVRYYDVIQGMTSACVNICNRVVWIGELNFSVVKMM